MLYRDNVHADKVGYLTSGSRSLTQVQTNVHCYHWFPKDLSNKGYQTYQRVESPYRGSIGFKTLIWFYIDKIILCT